MDKVITAGVYETAEQYHHRVLEKVRVTHAHSHAHSTHVCTCTCTCTPHTHTHTASYPGPAQLFVAISTEKRERAWYLFPRE